MKEKYFTQIRKTINNCNNYGKGILCFCYNIPNKKTEEANDILKWKVTLQMENNSVDKFLQKSIKKNLIKREKNITMNFVKYKIY